MGIVMAIVMLASMPLHAVSVGASQIPPPPHLAGNLETQITYAHAGDEFVVNFDLSLLTTQGWTTADLFIHYDSGVLELIPYSINSFWGDTWEVWVGTNTQAPWRIISNAGAVVRPSGDIIVGIMANMFAPMPFPVTLSFRFKVIADAPVGMTTISWTPFSASSWGAGILTFAPPTNENFAHIMISPHLQINLEVQTVQANPGQEILVDIDMTLLTEQGWGSALFELHYDKTRLELIPYITVPFVSWFGGNGMLGVLPVINLNIDTGCESVRTARINFVSAQTMNNTNGVFATLRFRVIDNAPAGEALISWTPLDAAALSPNLGIIPIYFAPSTSVSYTSVTIN